MATSASAFYGVFCKRARRGLGVSLFGVSRASGRPSPACATAAISSVRGIPALIKKITIPSRKTKKLKQIKAKTFTLATATNAPLVSREPRTATQGVKTGEIASTPVSRLTCDFYFGSATTYIAT